MLDWQAIGVGFAFYLIFEGLMPFFNPDGFKKAIAAMLTVNTNSIRILGAFAIIAGCLLLYLIK